MTPRIQNLKIAQQSWNVSVLLKKIIIISTKHRGVQDTVAVGMTMKSQARYQIS